MREPSFWWDKPGLIARLLMPLGFCYGVITGRRMAQAGATADIPVICIGNFTLGGTGKTPTALTVARMLSDMGETPAFLTRGYGGRLAGPVQVDTATHTASDVGDEPLLLARQAPVIVSRDRVAGAKAARAAGASVIVMDDGLQNPSLTKDLSIAVVDARRGVGNGLVFPAGPSRAPLAVQSRHIDVLLLIGEPGPAIVPELATPRLHGRLEPDTATIASFDGRKLLAFAGIGDPAKFFATLAASGLSVASESAFPDHHPYTRADAERILARCDADALTPVTTEKDAMRLAKSGDDLLRQLAARVTALPVTLVIDEADILREMLRQTLAAARKS